MTPEFAHAVAASKRAKKLMADADRAVNEADMCSRVRGHDSHDKERRTLAVGDGLAAMQAAREATAVAAVAMHDAFQEWSRANRT